MRTKSVAVIGAGIAGLTAAYELSKSGADVTVFEASERVGGRMSTDRCDGYLIDRGAQFLSDGYEVIGRLIAETGLQRELHATSLLGGTVRDGRIRRVNQRMPTSIVGSGLLGPIAALRLAAESLKLRARSARLSLSDYSAWCAFDDCPAEEWLRARFGSEVLEYVFEPMIAGFYFQEPEQVSAALAAWVWNYAMRGHGSLALENGIGSLPDALASKLNVRLSSPVRSVRALGEEGVEISLDGGTIEADDAILAVPAPAARSAYAARTDDERRLLQTRYSSTINAALIFDDRLPDLPAARSIYGLLVPRSERRAIAGIGIESRKCASYVPRGELLNAMLDGISGERLIDASDEEILAEIFNEIEIYFPGIGGVSHTYLHRWRNAEPYSYVGRSRDVREYRLSACASSHVLLCGDYMSTPTTEGAAESGAWAADVMRSRN